MPQADISSGERRHALGRRNLLVLTAAVAVLVAGYLLLSAGRPSAAAVLLVIGYCVLVPLAVAL